MTGLASAIGTTTYLARSQSSVQVIRVTVFERVVLHKIDNELFMLLGARGNSALVRNRVADDSWGEILRWVNFLAVFSEWLPHIKNGQCVRNGEEK